MLGLNCRNVDTAYPYWIYLDIGDRFGFVVRHNEGGDENEKNHD